MQVNAGPAGIFAAGVDQQVADVGEGQGRDIRRDNLRIAREPRLGGIGRQLGGRLGGAVAVGRFRCAATAAGLATAWLSQPQVWLSRQAWQRLWPAPSPLRLWAQPWRPKVWLPASRRFDRGALTPAWRRRPLQQILQLGLAAGAFATQPWLVLAWQPSWLALAWQPSLRPETLSLVSRRSSLLQI